MIDRAFDAVCADFVGYEQALSPLLEQFRRVLEGQDDKWLFRACVQILESSRPPWPRYDEWLLKTGRPDPRKSAEDDEDDGGDYREQARFFLNRVLSIHYQEERRARYIENISDRPFWRLVADMECPLCADDPKTPMRWDSEYWKNKKTPCEWLNCKSRVAAMTIEETQTKGMP